MVDDRIIGVRKDIDAITGLLVLAAESALNETFKDSIKLLVRKIDEERSLIRDKYECVRNYDSLAECIEDQIEKFKDEIKGRS